MSKAYKGATTNLVPAHRCQKE